MGGYVEPIHTYLKSLLLEVELLILASSNGSSSNKECIA